MRELGLRVVAAGRAQDQAPVGGGETGHRGTPGSGGPIVGKGADGVKDASAAPASPDFPLTRGEGATILRKTPCIPGRTLTLGGRLAGRRPGGEGGGTHGRGERRATSRTPASPPRWRLFGWLRGRERRAGVAGAPGAARALPRPRADRRGRDGPRAARLGRHPAPERGAQDAEAEGPVLAAAVPARGPRRGADQPSQRLPHLRGRRGGRVAVSRHGAAAGRDARRQAATGARCRPPRRSTSPRTCWPRSRALHDAGVVHRDLKPSNIFLTPTAPSSSTSAWPASCRGTSPAPSRRATDLTRPGLIVGPRATWPRSRSSADPWTRAPTSSPRGPSSTRPSPAQRAVPGRQRRPGALADALRRRLPPSPAPRCSPRSTRRSGGPWPRRRPSGTPPLATWPTPCGRGEGGRARSARPRTRGVRRPPGGARVAPRAVRGRRGGGRERRLRHRRARGGEDGPRRRVPPPGARGSEPRHARRRAMPRGGRARARRSSPSTTRSAACSRATAATRPRSCCAPTRPPSASRCRPVSCPTRTARSTARRREPPRSASSARPATS